MAIIPRNALVKIDTAQPFLERAAKLNKIAYIHGPSGIGKSAVVRQLADKIGAYLIIISLGSRDAVN